MHDYARATHAVVDLETFGLNKGSVILSVGIVAITNLELSTELHMHLNIPEQIAAGRTIDPDTVMWWFKQGAEARLLQADASRFTLRETQVVVRQFFDTVNPRYVWGNAPSFDLDMLGDYLGGKQWQFFQECDVRTLRRAFNENFDAVTGHDALSDAKAEAEMLIRIFKSRM